MDTVKRFLKIYSAIFFSDTSFLGGIIILATFLDVNTGLSGLIAVLSAILFSKLTFAPKTKFEPYYFYNPLLVGLSIGVLFKISILTLILLFASGILTFVITVILSFMLKKFTGLPVLSIPFVIVSSFVYLATIHSSNLFSNYLVYQNPVTFSHLPDWINGYFLSLGSIFFSKNVVVGLLVAIALLVHSRIVFVLSIIGYYTGALITGEFNSAMSSTYMNLNYFNYILISIAVGSIYLIPCFKSYVIAIFAVIVSYVILGAAEVLFQFFTIPVFTMPFNLTVLCFIYYSDIINSRLRTYTYLENPEANLDFYHNYTKRFGYDVPLLSLPFSGEWLITQGFDDTLTHKGLWKYGVDFILVNDHNEQYSGDSARLESYFAFDKPVLAPVSGRVVSVENDVADNEPGSVNREQNWGNNIIIFDSIRSIYVKICHLKKGSIKVEPGMFVDTGKMIGHCGNSGYSPAPHIHIQIQTGPENSSPTIEFKFEQVIMSGKFYDRLTPEKNHMLSSLYSSGKKKKLFGLLLGDKLEYNITFSDKPESKRKVKLEVVLDTDGTYYLSGEDSRLYFSLYKNIFRFYKYRGNSRTLLRYIYLVLPSIPLCDNKIEWYDLLPLEITLNRVYKNILLFFQSFYYNICRTRTRLYYCDDQNIESINTIKVFNKKFRKTVSTIKLDERKFIDEISIKNNNFTVSIKKIENVDEKQ